MTARDRPAGRKQAKQTRDRWRRELAQALQQQARRYAVPINDAQPLPRID